jgi:AcrR family transcriptional regulator
MSDERRTRANGRASRKAILVAATDVFAEKGYRGTSLTEIANRVGMTQPGLLHHFKTKDELLLAVVEDYEALPERVQSFQERLAPERFELAAQLEHLASTNAGARQEQLLLTTLSAEAIPLNHPLHEYFLHRYKRFRRSLTEIFVRAQESGAVRPDVNAADVAREVIATLDGLHLQWLLDPKEINLKKAMRDYARRLTAELSPTNDRARS